MHLVKGNYGPHTGQPRAQEAPTSARAPASSSSGLGPSGLRPTNALLGGVADQDDVEGILQQVRKDVRGIQATLPIRGRELDGRWCVKGHNVQIVVNDGAVMALGGQPQLITFEGPGQFYINDQGTRVDGVLVGTEIHWSDGDVWIAMQDMDSVSGASGAKSLSRNRSDATWDRPRTKETQEAPRAQPKAAAVRGRYVFSGDAGSQVLTGQMDRHRASTDFADERVTSQLLTPRKPGGGNSVRTTGQGSSSSQKQLRPLPEIPDCTDYP